MIQQHIDRENSQPLMGSPRRMIVGISGATGVIYATTLLQALASLQIESHLVVSKAAIQTINLESEYSFAEIRSMATKTYDHRDIGAGPASGSFRSIGMIIAPCSMRTVGEIASGTCDNLITRSADVCLKERRPLVVAARETPLHVGHLRNMTTVAEYGAIIAPPMPAFYIGAETMQQMVAHQVGRWLDLFGIDNDFAHRWKETPFPEHALV